MMLLRHRYLRRLITFTAVWALLIVVLTTLPLGVLAAAAISPFVPGRWRPLRLLWFFVVYLVLEAIGIVTAGALWVATGFGSRFGRMDVQEVHYRLVGSLLDILVRTGRRAFRVELDITAAPLPHARPEVDRGPEPLIVLSRHAGPGDSFLLVHELLTVYGRRPRIVLKDTLQWDPMIDLLLNRLPTRFISPNPTSDGVVESIAALATGMTDKDALVIFPEGGNYTERRHTRAIERLEAAGDTKLANRARGIRHLLAPRPGGMFAAINAAPTADVVFVAHTGLEQLSSVRDLWNGLPMDSDVRVQFWVVDAEDVPEGRAEEIDWLYDWWECMDTWIEQHQ